MAGKRHHIIPQFLQKGFASKVVGEKVFVHVFPKNRPPFETNTVKAAVGKHFYGKEKELSADEEITELERNVLVPLLNELRTKTRTEELVDVRILDLVVHFLLRSKLVREIARSSTQYLIQQIKEYLSDFNNSKQLILNAPEMVEEKMDKFLKEQSLSRNERRLAKKRGKKMLPSFLHKQKEEYQVHINSEIEKVLEVLPGAVRDGHIEILKKHSVPEARAERYSKLRWFVVVTKEQLILGDSCILFENEGEVFKTFDSNEDDLVNVFFPINENRILVGSVSSISPTANVTSLNKQIARHSREYFISAVKSPETVRLQSLIGTGEDIVTKDELQQIVEELKGKIKKGSL